MCFTDNCPKCNLKGWKGCGSHIAAAMDAIPEDEWCTCEPKTLIGDKEYPPKIESKGFLGFFGM